MPNGCLRSLVIVLLYGLDRGFLMDVGPEYVGQITLAASVDPTDARNASCRITFGVSHRSVLGSVALFTVVTPEPSYGPLAYRHHA